MFIIFKLLIYYLSKLKFFYNTSLNNSYYFSQTKILQLL